MGTIWIGLHWNVNYAISVDVQQICCPLLSPLCHWQNQLGTNISGVHAIKWVYRERYNLARAALQVLLLCVCVLLFALPGQLFSSGHTELRQCSDTLMNRWSLYCTTAGQQPLRAEEGDRERPKESERMSATGADRHKVD